MPALRSWLPGLPPAILLPALVLLGLASVGLHLGATHEAIAAPLGPGLSLVAIVVITCGVLSLLAAVEGSPTLRRVLAVALLAVFALMLLARLGGARHPSWFGPHPSWHQLGPELAFGLLLTTALAIGGIIARTSWARWLAIAMATAGLVHAGFDAWAADARPSASTWLSAVQAAGSLLLLGNLTAVETAHDDTPAPSDSVWGSHDGIVPWLRAAVIASFVAIPTLLAHAWMQAGRPTSLGGWDVVLAGTLALGSIATLRSRTVGLMVLATSALGLLALLLHLVSAATTTLDHRIAIYHATFWLPAAACNLAALLALLRTLAQRSARRRNVGRIQGYKSRA